MLLLRPPHVPPASLLGRSASAAEVKKAYKRLALLYHPDKHKGEGEEQAAAVHAKFKQARGREAKRGRGGEPCCVAGAVGCSIFIRWARPQRPAAARPHLLLLDRWWRRLMCWRMRSSAACTTSVETTW